MKIDWKKAIGLTAAVSMLVPLAACGGSSDGGDKNASGSTEAVTLSVWAPQEDQAKDTNWLGKVEENFAKAHPEYNITWKNDVVSEGDASKQVSTDPSAAADVYMFASDQLGVLMDAKAIGQLGTDAEKQVKEQNGDLEVNSVTGTDGKLYGVPYTDNTWFMYYNKSKITEDEAKDFDTILSKAKVAFSLQNSWYINGFYDGLSLFGEKGNDADAGMVFPKDGADITSYLVDVVANPNFSNDDGASGLAAIKDGSADVLFSGTWSAKDVKEALGDNYAATSLPTFTVNGQKKQMKSFAATKAAAYNPTPRTRGRRSVRGLPRLHRSSEAALRDARHPADRQVPVRPDHRRHRSQGPGRHHGQHRPPAVRSVRHERLVDSGRNLRQGPGQQGNHQGQRCRQVPGLGQAGRWQDR